MKLLKQSSSPWSGGTLLRQQRRNSSRTLQLGRSCAQCFGTEKAFCLWNSCLKAHNQRRCLLQHTSKLHCTIQNKQRGMLSRGVVMIHDNTCLHTAIQNLIMTFGWEQFDHPPYSPDLAPSDFHLFLHLKSFLAGWRLHEDSEVKDAFTACFA